ncbi:MAG: four helix bundle protein [Sphingobacteriales bacterium]|jgi:four helix bundle protein|nr:MAG: four helix bundle protein [Sphingobacteriales bacterium]
MRHEYRKLKVWQKSMDLSVLIYQTTGHFPKDEAYALVSQLKRAVVSIPSNIAEGSGRNTDKEFIQFLFIAYGSSCELDTQIELSKKLGFISDEEFNSISSEINEIQKMIFKLRDKLLSNLEK